MLGYQIPSVQLSAEAFVPALNAWNASMVGNRVDDNWFFTVADEVCSITEYQSLFGG